VVSAAQIRSILAPFAAVEAAYLFGSQAKGTASAASDVDIALILQPGTPADSVTTVRRALQRGLELEVDIIDLLRAPADLVHRVLRDGILVLDRNRQRRLSIEVQRRAEFLDLKPYLDRYRDRATR